MPVTLPRSLSRLMTTLRKLRRDESGVSVIEFAVIAPIFATMSIYGMEIAYMASSNMQISQIALSVADNASRLGQTDNSAVTPTISEESIDAVLGGAMRQGKALKFEEHGVIILSSLEKDKDSGKQYIHWQRCSGDLDRDSRYGNDTDRNGLTGPTLAGMGEGEKLVTALNDKDAVMYVEVYYEYQPLFGDLFVKNQVFREEAAFIIRDDRNLAGGGGDGLTGTKTSTCS